MKIPRLLAVLGLSVAMTANASTLSNGDFEAGALGAWQASGNIYLVPSAGGNFWFGAGSQAQDGTYAIAFNAGDTAPNGAIWQSFATTAGAHYTVNFNYGATNCAWTCGQQLNASVFGAGMTQLAGSTVFGQSSGPLASYSLGFVANGNQSTLRFSDLASNDSHWLDGVIDNVSVSKVPEPGSLALLGLAMAGMGALRRRKN